MTGRPAPLDSHPVVVLNGTSSAGKTSIARLLGAWSSEPLVYSGIDVALMSIPMHLHGHPEGPHFVKTDAGVVIKLGPQALSIVSAWLRAEAELVRAGHGLVLDEVFLSPQHVASFVRAFAGARVWMIGVVCDEEVAVAREAARGDREPGLARGTASIVHQHVEYDLVVDTTTEPGEEVVRRVLSFIATSTPSAFDRLTAAHAGTPIA